LAFTFGRNWRAYVEGVTEDDVASACRDLEALAGQGTIAGKEFLDAGCGSGMSSLAALRLGASRVTGFDADRLCVEATRVLLGRLAAGGPWTVTQGSLTDAPFLEGLGEADVVYCWGVLPFTGEMWRSTERIASLVRPGGVFCTAIYKRTWSAPLWRHVKRVCARLPWPVLALFATLLWLPRACVRAIRLRHPFRDRRGMSTWHDAIDWLGGYPYEYAGADEVTAFLSARGFEPLVVKPASGNGCSEYAFRRTLTGASPS